jgi:hypothetical protein
MSGVRKLRMVGGYDRSVGSALLQGGEGFGGLEIV